MGDLVEPACEGAGADFFGALGEQDEDGLGDVFGEMGIAQDALGGGMDGGEVTVDELAEGCGGARWRRTAGAGWRRRGKLWGVRGAFFLYRRLYGGVGDGDKESNGIKMRSLWNDSEEKFFGILQIWRVGRSRRS